MSVKNGEVSRKKAKKIKPARSVSDVGRKKKQSNGAKNQLAPPTKLTIPNSQSSPHLSPAVSPRSNQKPSNITQLKPVRSPRAASPNSKSPRAPNGDEATFSSIGSADSNVFWRTVNERTRNPTQLNFERKRLQRCKKIKDEPDVELINYQHNLIERIEFLDGFRKLVFLDFYDNRLTEISGLSSLPSLQVLMLGKNQIREISGLENAKNLDILDLHSNLIGKINSLSHLHLLRILNLSGNQISQVEDISGLIALTELNLRRNRVHTLRDVDKLHNLEKLFLSYNDLVSEDYFWDLLSECPSLSDLTLDGNPLAAETHYKTTVLKCLPRLKQLDMRKITEGERNIIERAIKKEAEKQKKVEEKAGKVAERANRIQAAQEAWEAQQEDMGVETKLLGAALAQDLKPERTVLFGKEKPGKVGDKGYAEILGDTLKFYGKDSLSALEKNWGYQAMSAVTNVKFKFVDFSIIASLLGKLKLKFPRIEALIFSHTNLISYQQLNALTSLRKLARLVISPKGNPLHNFTLWKDYIAFRLARELGLTQLNNAPISEEMMQSGRERFGKLDKTYIGMSFTMRLIALGNLNQVDSKNPLEAAKKHTNDDFIKLITHGNPKIQKSSTLDSEAQKLLEKAEKTGKAEERFRLEVAKEWDDCFESVACAILEDMQGTSGEAYLKERLKKFHSWHERHGGTAE